MSLIHFNGVEDIESSAMEQLRWKSQICTNKEQITRTSRQGMLISQRLPTTCTNLIPGGSSFCGNHENLFVQIDSRAAMYRNDNHTISDVQTCVRFAH